MIVCDYGILLVVQIEFEEESQMQFLDEIRTAKELLSFKKRIYITIGILFFGILMGTFSKYLDYRHAELPQLFQIIDYALDFHNFLGGFAPWIVIAVGMLWGKGLVP